MDKSKILKAFTGGIPAGFLGYVIGEVAAPFAPISGTVGFAVLFASVVAMTLEE